MSFENLFLQQVRQIPVIESDRWQLTLGGMVEEPVIVSYDDLRALNPVEMPCTLLCSGHQPDNPLISDSIWYGAPLHPLLKQARLWSEARFIRFDAADGYSTSVELERLKNALLVYDMNGDVLTPEHGFPTRLIIPGLYGYKLPKWITRIEASDRPFAGFWERRGWPQSGTVQTTSAILYPHNVEPISGAISLKGMAYAGDRQIIQIEISIDDGPWMPVPFASETSNTQVRWQIDWTPPAPADYLFKVRATDSLGFTQTDIQTGPTLTNTTAIIVRVVS